MPHSAQIILEQLNPKKGVDKLTIINVEYNIRRGIKLDTDKLTDTLTSAVMRRYEAEKNGLKLGFKASKPMLLRVIIDNKEVLNTDKLRVSTGALVKLNSSLFAKDQKKEQIRFNNVLSFIISEAKTLNSTLRSAFVDKEEQKAIQDAKTKED